MAGGEAVGRPDARSTRGIPEEAIDIETTGHVASPNVEKIVALQPDLVILSGGMDNHRNVKEILDQNGTENILLKYENYHDFVYTLDLFARIVGNQEIIQEKVPGIQREVQKVIERYEDEPPFTFLSLFAFTRSVSAELNRANTAHMAMMLGGKNIAEKGAPERGQKRITLSMEHIVQRDPDVILVTVMGDLKDVKDKMKEDLTSNQAWDGIEAVKNDRVHYLPAEYFLYKANERYPEAFEYLAERIYQQ
jgi:iron complex transport system substrate-binding protein